MKVIKTDNFDRDYIPEECVASGLSPGEAKAMCEALNKGATDSSPWWHLVKPDEYRPRTAEDCYN